MSEHHVDIDAYVAGQLAPNQAAGIEQHIDSCEVCRMDSMSLREMREFLGEVPHEALLDGYPDDADLVLQRTLRQVRTEKSVARRRSRFLSAAAAVIAAAALVTGGMFVGQMNVDQPQQVAVAQPQGVRFANATDGATGARLVVRVTPAADWIRVNAAVSGIKAGEMCRLIVVTHDGTREAAGSWVVPATEAASGTTLDGSALISAKDVAAVIVENTDGKHYVTASI
ncbi:zf-HC2 domain-containing protein [Kibdelosporangium philippinense]|uniref:Zf-HC2 domain-containing protein n=1 Tax=Kibdelosporangium philippinense TaxID=211113 RepID=A0ABS8ZEV4_9PSEU|nr:zf-HC2 domain-containing protein [Kibdelosporangium philippinense]MCE7006353.1 zf-HC2 domain-containing protein [Kibdelosporangium philippinense]